MDVLRQAAEWAEAGQSAALATIVATRGSTPQKVGARLLVGPENRRVGTLGGGAVEAEAIEETRRVLASARPVLRQYDLAGGTDDWGLACGGTMEVLFEPIGRAALGWLRALATSVRATDGVALAAVVEGRDPTARLLVHDDGRIEPGAGEASALGAAGIEAARRILEREGAELIDVDGAKVYVEAFTPPPTLVVAGAGHVGKALAGLARFLGVRVVVVDDRPDYASRARFPEADEVIAAPVTETLAQLPMGRRSAIVVAMRNQDLDGEATVAALRSPARYVGLIGARRKAILVTERALAAGLPAERVRALRSPIGLDIGARTPEEIALSILAEWIMLRQGAPGRPLRLPDDLFARAAEQGGPPR